MKLSRYRNLIFLCLAAGGISAAASTASPQTPQAVKSPAEIASISIAPNKKAEPGATDGRNVTSTNLNRVGVQTAQPLPLSLSEAIRRALESNNDIEVSRDDVRFQETQVRSVLGVYDPVFTATPNFSHSQS